MYDRANPSLLQILGEDDTLPLDPHVQALWIANLRSPLRRGVLSLTRIVRTLTLYVFYFVRRITPGFLQFSFPNLLQRIICFFMKWFVTPEANYLILRHFWAESNIINFIIKHSRNRDTAELLSLYPRTIDDLLVHTFVKHDIALFNAFHDLGSIEQERWPVPGEALDFSGLRPIEVALDPTKRRFTQIIDFETAHELFKATFCLLLTWDEYERSVVSLQFDQLLAIRLSRIVGDPMIAALATNRFPMLLMGPTGVGYRFILHGLFTEYVHEHLVRLSREAPERRAAS
jgi:hypothetical protein